MGICIIGYEIYSKDNIDVVTRSFKPLMRISSALKVSSSYQYEYLFWWFFLFRKITYCC